HSLLISDKPNSRRADWFPFYYLLIVAIARFSFFFFNDTAATEIYTLSLHDALPIWKSSLMVRTAGRLRESGVAVAVLDLTAVGQDRKSTRLNSSHSQISYAVFCLKKKNMP